MILMHMAWSSRQYEPISKQMDPVHIKLHDFHKQIMALDQVQVLDQVWDRVLDKVQDPDQDQIQDIFFMKIMELGLKWIGMGSY